MKKILLFFVFLGVALSIFWGVSGMQTKRVQATYENQMREYGQTILIDGMEVFYREAGNEHPQTIVMIHGFLGSSYDFIDVFMSLKQTYHVVAIDLIGFGYSEKSATFEYYKENQAHLIAQLLDTKGWTEVILMGHSMGGEVSLHLAKNYPTQIKQLILIGSAGLVADQPQALGVWFYDLIFKNYYLQKLGFRGAFFQTSNLPANLYDQMYFFNVSIPAEVMQRFSLFNDSGVLATQLTHITQPTLLIWGREDQFVPLVNGEQMHQLLPNNELVIIEHAGHLPFREQFDAFMAAVNLFLNH